MKITIITVCYNAKNTIRNCLVSAQNQTDKNFEHIIVDGKSTDGTIEIIKKFKNCIWVSEFDTGIYNAMNKGIQLASGDYITFLNADDELHNSYIASVRQKLKSCECDYVTTGILLIDPKKNKIKKWSPSLITKKKAYKRMPTPHPGFLISKNAVKALGGFDENYKLSADYDFMIRISKSHLKGCLIDEDLVRFRADGASSSIFGIIENFKVRRSHSIPYYQALFRLFFEITAFAKNELFKII